MKPWMQLQGVAQLVARTAGGREVAGSSPVTLTIQKAHQKMGFLYGRSDLEPAKFSLS